MLELEPSGPLRREPSPAQVHGLACQLLDADDDAHREQDKPWSAWPVDGAPGSGSAVWRLHWLRDATAPPAGRLRPGIQVRLGAQQFTVRGGRLSTTPYAELARREAAGVRMWFHSPTCFSRNGRFYPLPDPVLLFRGLAARWSRLSNEPAPEVPTAQLDELLGSVAVVAHELSTVRIDIGSGQRPGFTGWADFAPTGQTGPSAGRLLAALACFAEYAGVGSATTHGLGAVSVELRPRRHGAHPAQQDGEAGPGR